MLTPLLQNLLGIVVGSLVGREIFNVLALLKVRAEKQIGYFAETYVKTEFAETVGFAALFSVLALAAFGLAAYNILAAPLLPEIVLPCTAVILAAAMAGFAARSEKVATITCGTAPFWPLSDLLRVKFVEGTWENKFATVLVFLGLAAMVLAAAAGVMSW